MGHTLLPLPAKLVKKITNLEFVDMAELKPESWILEEEEKQPAKCCHTPSRRRTPVRDILTWVQCFASYVSVLAQSYPGKISQLMAYMCTIIRIEKDFEDNAWQNYDVAFRRQAACTKSLEWGMIDPTLYSMALTGHSKRKERCGYCFSADHRTAGCPIQMQQHPWQWMLSQHPPPPAQHDFRQERARSQKRRQTEQNEICYLFNAREGNKCFYRACKFSHACLLCRGNHPRSKCDRKRPREEKDSKDQ